MRLIGLAAMCVAGLLAVAGGAQAAIVNWTVSGTFYDSDTFSGTFTIDTTAGVVTDWNIHTVGTVTIPRDSIYSPTSPTFPGLPGDTAFNGGGFPTFWGHYSDVLTRNIDFTNIPFFGSGTVSNLTGGEHIKLWGVHPLVDRAITSGTAVGVIAAPEPATWAMLLLGFFGLGAALRRQKGQTLAEAALTEMAPATSRSSRSFPNMSTSFTLAFR